MWSDFRSVTEPLEKSDVNILVDFLTKIGSFEDFNSIFPSFIIQLISDGVSSSYKVAKRLFVITNEVKILKIWRRQLKFTQKF